MESLLFFPFFLVSCFYTFFQGLHLNHACGQERAHRQRRDRLHGGLLNRQRTKSIRGVSVLGFPLVMLHSTITTVYDLFLLLHLDIVVHTIGANGRGGGDTITQREQGHEDDWELGKKGFRLA